MINSIQDVLDLQSEVILLKVIPPMSGQRLCEVLITTGEREESERVKEMSYLRAVIRRFGARADQFRCEVVVSKSVAEGITGVAAPKRADLIAMYTHDRKGLARLVKGSIVAKVEREPPTEVRVFKPTELADVGA